MNIFHKAIEKLPALTELEGALGDGISPCLMTGVSAIHKAQIILSVAEGLKSGATALVITEDEAAARRFAEDINSMAGGAIAAVYPAKDMTLTHTESISREYEHQRIGVLSSLISENVRIVCAGVEAAMQRTLPPEELKKASITLRVGDEMPMEELARRLIKAGYTRSEQVDGAAQFAIRGAICDVFPVQSPFPFRIELWGDEIDTIACFDAETQRRSESTRSIKISPAFEIMFDSGEILAERIEALAAGVRTKKAAIVREELLRDADKARQGISLDDIDKYLPLAYKEPALITDYLREGSVCFFCESANIIEKAKSVTVQHSEDVKLLLESGELCRGLQGYIAEIPELLSEAEKRPTAYLETFMRGSDVKYRRIISVNAYQSASWGGEIRHLTEDLSSYISRGYSVILMAGSDKTLPILEKDLREDGIPCEIVSEKSELTAGRVLLMTGSVSGGYEYPDCKTALITQTKAYRQSRRSARHKKGEEIKSLSDISEGDLVVHSLHGIGRFIGIRKLELEGVTKDYITIQYAGTDVLYVPVTQLDLVSRYIGPRDDGAVKLHKLSSVEWQKTRSRVKSAVKDMAQELIQLYAKRQNTPGFAFSEDNDWQADFEGRFEYNETDDQLRSIEEIKSDMKRPYPMDRLLCGDVGFGKTEVALRAAFKCVLDSKQCAILVPTTVLAWQHYQTAIKRFEHFPIKVELLSRFRTAKEQQRIIKDLKRGLIDIIIGTHRLIQKDVEFKDLGLAIIDEEQRFGVAHKERFKEVFAGVDVLTLSATPIPRTLNMAMSGIRDMSVIEEPPQDRYPVQTYVIEQNMGVVAQAISKELRRGGQVYYIHNRIETIDSCAARIHELLPDARIGIAHGKITEEELSEIWRQLIEHEIDILVCTTLIETGVDVPNVNTLIIEDADRLGLSQLYQLRGRVGRSSRRAFAYFMFRRGKVLSEVATKRLDAIREFTQFGSGFRIAMRDLEIRGAGSILGGKQHGHMEAVGYDMYIKLLNEAIAEEKGEPIPQASVECLVDIQIDAHIPESYITSLSGRIDVYRKIASVRTEEDSSDIIDELIDRYGDPPRAILGLVKIALLRNMASTLGITEITQRGESIIFYIAAPTMEQISALSGAYKGRVIFNSMAKPYISVRIKNGEKTLELIGDVLTAMTNA